MDIAEKLLNWC